MQKPKSKETKLKEVGLNHPEINTLLNRWKELYPDQFKNVLVDVEYLMRTKSPAVRSYPSAFTGSLDCQMMSLAEFACYNWILYYAWESDIQCFLEYDLKRLIGACQQKLTPKKFLRHWEHLLQTKFKFAKHGGVIYIYNQRQFDELMKQKVQQKKGSSGGKTRVENLKHADEKKRLHTFDKSPYFKRERFMAELKSDPHFTDVDHEHYYQVVINWTKQKNPAPKNADWIAFSKSIILNNIKKSNGKVHVARNVKPELKSKIEKNFADNFSRKESILKEFAE